MKLVANVIILIVLLVFSGNLLAEEVDDTSEYKDPALSELLSPPSSLMGATPLRLSLNECLKISLEHNAKLQAQGYGVQAAEAQLMEATAIGWPIMDYEYRTAPVPSDVKHALPSFFSGDWAWYNRIKFTIFTPLYTFGKVSLAKEMARSGITVAEVQAYQEKNILISRVRQLYYGVLLAEEIGHLVAEAHERLQNEINKREKKEDENGEDNGEETSSPMQNLKMKVALFDLEKRLAEARQKEALALEGLRIQMGLSQGTVFTVASDKLRPVDATIKEYNDYITVAMSKRADLKQLENGVDVKKNQYILEKRKLLPDIGFGAYLEVGRTMGTIKNLTVVDDWNDPFNYARAGIGLQMQGRLDFHGGAARIKKAQSEYFKLNLEQMMAKEAVKLEVKDAFLKAKYARDNLGRAREAEKTARQFLFLAQSNYDIGVGEQSEIVEALQLVLLTRGRYFESVFDFNISLANLDEKIGLTPEVNNDEFRIER